MTSTSALTTQVVPAALTEAGFPDFFREIHGPGWHPFPWQAGLLGQVLAGGWRSLIDVPTGLGKTAVLDVAVFAAALGCPAARRRIFLVVDRRIIVDQAHRHALKIQEALKNPPGPVCREVARRLAARDDDGPVLDVTRMRGGADWGWLWLERPDRCGIITGTVDQIGSRLLFRGYGAGDKVAPIDAALVGTDSLILVDEAHLADVFVTTLRDLRALDRAAQSPFPAPVVVAMSASPGDKTASVHRISDLDEADEHAAVRLRAPRQLHLEPIGIPTGTPKETVAAVAAEGMADALAGWALRLGEPGKVTGVVVNTVAMARAVFSRLQAAVDDPLEQCMLLTGRIRPIDREYVLHRWLPRIQADERPGQEEGSAPLYVVATQTIEAGADIDLDALVTEAPALPALIQRLGRLNRRGERGQAPAVVLYCKALPPGVYGPARDVTYRWLQARAARAAQAAKAGKGRAKRARNTAPEPSPLLPGIPLDASPLSLRALLGAEPDDLAAMYGPGPYAPLLTRDALRAWARTSPAPSPDGPVAPYLHGVDQGSPVVTVCWRSDMEATDTAAWARSAELIPPSSDESVELPLTVVRRWLLGRSTPQLADTGAQVLPGDDPPPRGRPRPVLRYRGTGDADVIEPSQIRPGDTLLAPARYGGCDQYGWDPDSHQAVTDVADLAGGTRRHPAAVRVSPLLVTALRKLAHLAPGLDTDPVITVLSPLIARIRADARDGAADPEDYRDALAGVAAALDGAPDLPHVRVLRQLAGGFRLSAIDSAGGTAVLLTATGTGSVAGDDTSAAGSAAAGHGPLSLRQHQEEVAARAWAFATSLGLPPPLVGAVTLAARWHDEGKRDPRFQQMLHGGDHWAALIPAEPLAKSGMDPSDRAAFRRARRLSGYPTGMRHEDLSARIAAAYLDAGITPALDDVDLSALDRDLVLHLIASHHGRGRPLMPPVDDDAPVQVTVPVDGREPLVLGSQPAIDWKTPDRFAALCERYGYWGLAGLEAIVRLADIWCSARPGEVP